MRRADLCLRFAWIIQFCVAISTTFVYTIAAILILFFNGINTFSLAYAFVTDVSIASAAGTVTWTIVCQFRHAKNHAATRQYEIRKSSLATFVWIWLMFDAVFGPLSRLGDGRYQRKRIASAVSLLLVPCTIFYPSSYHALRNRVDGARHAAPAYLESSGAETVAMSEAESASKTAELT
ncbi:hypothetical protein LTR78_000673 [Recurvomyces mirabilis]|uniref:Uncharacterized protein n=1 Tax=Recurvomyces mirabilis TaxID=574656 RepID=A0AAE0WXQ5_9PEZI|nr:hypothetical protein LTR78_000673 [Recurvomyces mirabilis]KAK5162327.1 hypothetical protein LTS14_000674 [Recurvomyces mirabilis]